MKQENDSRKPECGWWCKCCQSFKSEKKVNVDRVCLDCYGCTVTWERKGDKS